LGRKIKAGLWFFGLVTVGCKNPATAASWPQLRTRRIARPVPVLLLSVNQGFCKELLLRIVQ